MARILVCEDSASQALNLRLILEKAGHEVVVAEDGQLGLQQLQGSAFDIVLSDVQMPNVGGFDLCRMIRQQPQLAALPVILMTTLREMQDMRRGHDVGANMYVVKPFQEDDLLRRLSRVLGGAVAAGGTAPAAAAAAPAAPAAAAPETAAPAAAATGAAAPAAPQPRLGAAQTGIVALRGVLARLILLTERGLSLCADDVLSGVLQNIHEAGKEALALCGGPQAVAATSSISGTVLLLEPNESLRNVLQSNLEKQAWRVRPVSTADAAITECRSVGSVIDIVVAEASACPPEAIQTLRRINAALKVLCMVDAGSGAIVPSDVSSLMRPFTVNALLARLKELQEEPAGG